MGKFRLLGTTIDDAVGEAFDKAAKLLGLPYPGGPNLEALAKQGDPEGFALPRPMLGREGADFSFSGLKTAVRQIVRRADFADGARADMAASFQAGVIDSLLDRVSSAMGMFRTLFGNGGRLTLVVAGGVGPMRPSAPRWRSWPTPKGFGRPFPPPQLCSDNAAMIAWAGVERAELGLFDSLAAEPKARWPLSLPTDVAAGMPLTT